MQAKLWLVCGAILAGLAVIAGAHGAHGLEKSLVQVGVKPPQLEKRMQQFDTAVRYQMYHAQGLILLGILARRQQSRSLAAAGGCMLLGTALFSGPLYALGAKGLQLHWAVIPSGGVLLIVGWFALALAMLMPSKASDQ